MVRPKIYTDEELRKHASDYNKEYRRKNHDKELKRLKDYRKKNKDEVNKRRQKQRRQKKMEEQNQTNKKRGGK